MKIVIDKDGTARAIYDDALKPILEDLGDVTVARASHVEPDGRGWSADMAPSNGPVLGSFALRGEALAAEVAWLEENIL